MEEGFLFPLGGGGRWVVNVSCTQSRRGRLYVGGRCRGPAAGVVSSVSFLQLFNPGQEEADQTPVKVHPVVKRLEVVSWSLLYMIVECTAQCRRSANYDGVDWRECLEWQRAFSIYFGRGNRLAYRADPTG